MAANGGSIGPKLQDGRVRSGTLQDGLPEQLHPVLVYGSIARSMKGFNFKYATLASIMQVGLQFAFWGFTVDDAWIVSRVAAHGSQFAHFEFNVGQATDAVTPLGFAHFLGWCGPLFGQSDALSLFELARALGLCAQLVSFFIAGGLLSSRLSAVFILLLSVASYPSALWAGAGLETPLVGCAMATALLASRFQLNRLAHFCLGGAVAWRPELGPYACGLAVVMRDPRHGFKGAMPALLALAGPVILIAALRLIWFGSPLPLSFSAKAPEFASGMRYSIMSLLWGGLIPLAIIGPGMWGWRRPALLVGLQLGALVICGGDWMPGFRLSAPIYPSLMVMIGLALVDRPAGGPWLRLWFWTSCTASLILPAQLVMVQGANYRAVVERRLDLIRGAQPVLRASRRVAAVDVGWVGIASEVEIIDLGGVTDPRIAGLPGGHTNRLISAGLFSDRDVDTWIIRAADRNYVVGQPLADIVPVYGTDARLLRRWRDLGMEAVATIPLAGTDGQYVIARLVSAQ